MYSVHQLLAEAKERAKPSDELREKCAPTTGTTPAEATIIITITITTPLVVTIAITITIPPTTAARRWGGGTGEVHRHVPTVM
ncbi:unnamed protein product [Closterium sp. NIES-54]